MNPDCRRIKILSVFPEYFPDFKNIRKSWAEENKVKQWKQITIMMITIFVNLTEDKKMVCSTGAYT